MKKFLTLLAGLGIAASAIPATAIAAPAFGAPGYGAPAPRGWENINARQARLESRIDQGVRSGALTRGEAAQLRREFNSLAQLEARYRRSAPGLTMAERRDLDRRFDSLSARIRVQKADWQHRR